MRGRTAMQERPRVVVVGAGFGGLNVARALGRAPVQVTIVDRTNHHLFQPLLYQIATAGMATEEIAVPIRGVLRHQRNTRVLFGEVTGVDLEARRVEIAGGRPLPYDFVVIAAGAVTNYFGRDDWRAIAPGLKTLDDALEIRRRILANFELADQEEDEVERQRLLTFVVIGGGPTGVELAGAISELSNRVLVRDFPTLRDAAVRVVLIEMAERVLTPFDPELSEAAARQLVELGAEVRLHSRVEEVTPYGVRLHDEYIAAGLTLWTTGVRPSPLAERIDTRRDGKHRLVVEADCSLPGHPEAFAIGDIAVLTDPERGEPLPGVAPVAMQQARHVAESIVRTLRGEPRTRFRYRDKGIMATVGRSRAVLQLGPLRMAGFFAWLTWIFVHIAYLIGFRTRVLVLFEWFWTYITDRHGARIVTSPVEAVLPAAETAPTPLRPEVRPETARTPPPP